MPGGGYCVPDLSISPFPKGLLAVILLARPTIIGQLQEAPVIRIIRVGREFQIIYLPLAHVRPATPGKRIGKLARGDTASHSI